MPFIGNTPDVNFTSFAKQDLTGVTGSPAKRGYTLSHAVANANEIEVFVNNVRQEPTESYTVNGTGLTMTGDVETSDDFYIIFLGKAIQTTVPPDGSVSTAKIADSAVDLTSKVTGVLPVANSQTNTPSFLAKMSDYQNLTDATDTKVQFDTEVYDTDGKYDHSTNYRFTPTVAGTYFLYTQVHVRGGTNTQIVDSFVYIKKNGSAFYTARHNPSSNYGNQTSIDLQVTDVVNATDYYEVFCYINSLSTTPSIMALDAARGVSSFFGAYKLIGA